MYIPQRDTRVNPLRIYFMSVAQQIARHRQLAGLTQAELARRAGCAQSQICKIEGGGGCSLETLQAIADALGESLRIEPALLGEE